LTCDTGLDVVDFEEIGLLDWLDLGLVTPLY
jgi:hypothetical protein